MRPWVLAETNYTHTKQPSVRGGRAAVRRDGTAQPAPPVRHGRVGGNDRRREDLRGGLSTRCQCGAAAHDPYGTQTNMREMPLAMNLNPSTLNALVVDLVESLERSGVRKIVLLNSHGGNEMKTVLRELCGRTQSHLVPVQLVQDVQRRVREHLRASGRSCGRDGDVVRVGLLSRSWCSGRPDGSLAADDGQPAAFRFEALERAWVSITRPWHLLTTNAGVGYPHRASAEKGRRLMELLIERLGTFLVELSAAPLDKSFPFRSP